MSLFQLATKYDLDALEQRLEQRLELKIERAVHRGMIEVCVILGSLMTVFTGALAALQFHWR